MSGEGRESALRRRSVLIVCAVVVAGATTVAQRGQVLDKQAQTAEPAFEILWQYDTGG